MTHATRPIRRVAAFFLPLLLPALIVVAACGKGKSSEAPPTPAPESTGKAAAPAKSPEQEALDNVVFLFESQRYDDAAAAAKAYLEKYPNSPRAAQALYLQGRALVSAGKFDEGVAALRSLLVKYPNDANAAFASFYAGQGLYLKAFNPLSEYKITFEEATPILEEAVKAFRETAEKYAGDAEVATRSRLMAAQALYDLRRREEALAGFREYLAKEPKGEYASQALFQSGAILVDLDRYDEARDAFARVMSEYPGTEGASSAVDRLAELNLVGHPMPEIQVTRWVNQGLMPEQWKGKVIVVTFWNTWCIHCQHDMPKIDALYRKLGGSKQLVMMGITDNVQGQSDAIVNKFVEEKRLTMPIGIDNHGATSSRYAVGRIPATAIIDRKGIVRWRNSGALLSEDLVRRFLGGHAASKRDWSAPAPWGASGPPRSGEAARPAGRTHARGERS